MGNFQALNKPSDIYDIKKVYWDSDGNLRHGTTDKNRDDEILAILQADTNDDSDPGKLWMIVPSRWIKRWLLFAHYKLGDLPGKIDTISLLVQDSNVDGGWRPKRTLKPPTYNENPEVEDTPGHYRRVSLEVWIKLVDLYNVQGYAIAVLGTPHDDLSRWRVFKNPRLIDSAKLPPPILPVAEEEKDDGKEKSKEKDKGEKKSLASRILG